MKTLRKILWWIIAAVLLISFGRFIDAYFKEKRVLWSYSILPFTLIAFGFILTASLNILIEIIRQKSLHSILTEYVLTVPFLASITGGLLIAFIGSVLYHILEDMFQEAST